MLNRRNILTAALAGTAIATIGHAASAAPAASTISVDVSPLVALGAGANAVRVRSQMERELAGLAPALRSNGTSLVVTVRGINMPGYSGGGSGVGGGSTNDGLDSTATLVGRDGRVIASYPVMSSSSAGMAGPWYAPDIDARRIESLVRTNAGWIRRYVAG